MHVYDSDCAYLSVWSGTATILIYMMMVYMSPFS